jgi:glycosyltransferase involved in cell wall biosynthesis
MINKTMKLSVIIPTYNGARTIRRAIESIINQTIKIKTEILICDDCSTDNTIEICQQYSECKIFRNIEHSGGPNKGRNIGIKNATGDIISFLDQDDTWFPNKLEIQLKELDNADFIYSRCFKIQE